MHTATLAIRPRIRTQTDGLCGPRALARVLRALGVRGARLDALARVVSDARGTSLATLASLAASIGAPMRCVWCPRGSALPGLAVAHCESEHFIARMPSERDDDDASGVLSGYLLVPRAMPLDPRWREVGALEASRVWGRGDTVMTDLGHYGAQDLMNGGTCGGIARYDFHGLLAALHVEDTPVWIRAPFGPQLVFTIAYNQADVHRSAERTPSGLPLKWTHNWNDFIRFTHRRGGSALGSSVAHLFRGGGGIERYVFEGEATDSDREFRSASTLSRRIASPRGEARVIECRLKHPDGSVEIYEESDGEPEPTLLLTQRIDPQGNAARLTYRNRELIDIADAFGQRMQFHRENGRISDISVYDRNFGVQGTARFEYDAAGRLTQITDMEGIRSAFGWTTAERGVDPVAAEDLSNEQLGGVRAGPDRDFMRWMRTPYGVTTFQTGWLLGVDGISPNERWIEATMPNGDTERVEYRTEQDLDLARRGRRGLPMLERDDTDPGPPSIMDAFRRADIVGSAQKGISKDDRNQLQRHLAVGQVSLVDWGFASQPEEQPIPEYLRDPNQALDTRNTLYWDPRAYRRAGGEPGRPLSSNPEPVSATPANRLLDHRYARITHWMKTPNPGRPETTRATGVVESTLSPGENRVWYYYQIQQYASLLRFSPALATRIARNIPRSTPRPPDDAGVEFTYDDFANVTSVTDPMGRQTVISYRENGVDVAEVRQRVGGVSADLVTRFEEYSERHLPGLIIDPAGEATRIYYNRYGQPLSAVLPDRSEVWLRYDSEPASPMSVNGHAETCGNLREVHAPSGTVRFEYDGRNRVRASTDPDGTTRTYDYDRLDRLVRVNHADGTTEEFGFQRLDPDSGVGLVFADRETIVPGDPSGRDGRDPVIALEWTSFKDRDGKEVRRAFDPQRRLTRIARGGIFTVFQYPDLRLPVTDELVSMADGKGYVTLWRQRDDAPELARFDNRPVEMMRPDGTVTRYSYDVLGRVERAEDVGFGRRTSVTYTADGRPFEVCASDDVETLRQRYDHHPFLPRITRARTVRHDGANPDGELLDDHEFYYTPSGVPGAGTLMLTRSARSGVHVAYAYDELGRLKTRTVGTGRTASSEFEVEYGGNGLVRSTHDVLGSSVFCYNDACDDSAASGGADASRLSGVTLPNGASLRFLHAPRGERREPRLTGYETRTGPTLMSAGDLRHRVELEFSPAGRRTAETHRWRQGGAFQTSWSRGYSYDGVGRLEGVVHAMSVDGASTFVGEDRYHFDDNSNLHTETNSGVGSGGRLFTVRRATTTYDNGDWIATRVVQTLGPTPEVRNVASLVDGAGQMLYDGQAHYTWDALGRLKGVTRDRARSRPSEFERDTFGRVTRIHDVMGARDLVWDGLTLLEERDAETHEVIRAYAASGFTQRGARYYYLRDPLGSIVGLMDQSGDVVKTWTYDAWGFRALSWQAEGVEEVEPSIGYAGYLQHEESGLCLMPARAYNPALRRWLSRDPAGSAGGDSNFYSYCGDDPSNRQDANGAVSQWVGAAIGAVAGGVAGYEYASSMELSTSTVFAYTLGGIAAGAVLGGIGVRPGMLKSIVLGSGVAGGIFVGGTLSSAVVSLVEQRGDIGFQPQSSRLQSLPAGTPPNTVLVCRGPMKTLPSFLGNQHYWIVSGAGASGWNGGDLISNESLHAINSCAARAVSSVNCVDDAIQRSTGNGMYWPAANDCRDWVNGILAQCPR